MKPTYFEKRKKNFSTKIKNKFVNQIPKNALVELTNACNHACIFCYNPEMKRSINSIDINIHLYKLYTVYTVVTMYRMFTSYTMYT